MKQINSDWWGNNNAAHPQLSSEIADWQHAFYINAYVENVGATYVSSVSYD